MEKFRKIYHTIKINPELLKHGKTGEDVAFSDFTEDVVYDTLPKGKLIGIGFTSYVKKLDTWSAIDYQGVEPAGDVANEKFPMKKSFICSHTKIRIKDTNDYPLTGEADLRSFEPESNPTKGYKEVDFELKANERVEINYELIGEDFPPCGEFVFIIEKEISC